MANPDRTESSTARTVSPPNGKRDREEDQEEKGRNTRHRTGDESAEPAVNGVEEVERIVLEELWNADGETAWKSMKKLSTILDDDDDNKRREKEHAFYHVGGHVLVVKAMMDHPLRRMIQLHGIVVIIKATYKSTSLCSAIKKVRAIPAILAAMKKFPADKDVLSAGFTALVNLAASEDPSNLWVTEGGQLAFFIERMKSFPQNAKVVDRFCRLLYNLSVVSAELKSAIIEAGSISALAMALETHKNNESIQEHARMAIVDLLTQD